MKSDGQMNQNTEHAEYQDIRQNTAEHARTRIYGGVLLAAFLFSGAVFWMSLSTPASAQVPTVTPLPGPVATATAAAQQMSDARQAKAQAAQQAAQAAQQAAAADAQFNAAQQAANEARALLASQQVAAASEALGRAEAAITSGKEQIGNVTGTIDALKSTINQQADRIVALSADAQQARIEAQQAKTDKGVILQNFTALQARNEEQSKYLTINPTVAAIIGIGTLFAVLIFVAWKWDKQHKPDNAPPPLPPINGEYRKVDDNGDTIDGDQDNGSDHRSG